MVLATVVEVAFENLIRDCFDARDVKLRDCLENFILLRIGEFFIAWLAIITRRYAFITPSKTSIRDLVFLRYFVKVRSPRARVE